ncbi:hypothetical protein SAMN04515618_101204 [Collimonas sp. OK307]|uniref:DUF1640 domain-containing protein n=1 Tax=Collimonas sp. OK307 TaxID=1801620 RepID=UPI0008F2F5DE|nr:DUF1640 domain-containing protein [Collimonas sp. OK307]SFH62540.1 hypothetical protein SAMN04515618_101204 [Collimonas sp. OK307]
MATVAFDTLKFVKTLEAAGIPFLQAEALSDAVRDSHEAADVATKHDVDDVKRDIDDVKRDIDDVRKDMHAMEARIDAKFEKFELRLTVKLGGIVVFALGALTVLPKWVA